MEKAKQETMMKLFAEYRSEFTPTSWLERETKRNTENIDLFEAIIREAFDGVTLVVAGHHIMFMQDGRSAPQEIASADTLIFDHEVAKKVWKENYKDILEILAVEPVARRDVLLRKLYTER